MNPKRRPPTSWLRRCMQSIARKGKLVPEAAQKVCANNWWHQAGAGAKREIVKKYGADVPRRARRRMLRAESRGAGYCRICRGPHKYKHGRP